MRKWIVSLLIICFITLPGCGYDTKQESGVTFSEWESRLCSLVDVTQDEYLNTLTGEETRAALSVRAIYPGSYTKPGAEETLCLLSISGVPHVGGLDRSILLLTDPSGTEVLGQTTVLGDSVEMVLLEDTEGRSYPLFLAVGVQQGVHTYYVEMYEATADGFVLFPGLEDLPDGEDFCYSFCAGDMIRVSAALPSEFPGASAEYQDVAGWQWDAVERRFKPMGQE